MNMSLGILVTKFWSMPWHRRWSYTVDFLRGLRITRQFLTRTIVFAGPHVFFRIRNGRVTGGRYCGINGEAGISVFGSPEQQAHLHIGEGTYIQSRTHINCANEIWIGDGCAISWDCEILDTDIHVLLMNGERQPTTAPIHIGDHVWIGVRSIILKGVTIGDHCMIAAGSVVTQDIPPFTLAAGVPARIVRKIDGWEKD